MPEIKARREGVSVAAAVLENEAPKMAPKRDPKRSDSADAFVPEDGRISDDAESFAEEFIASATRAEPVQQEAEDEVSDEENGGPFLIETHPEDDEADQAMPKRRSER
jgi:hypothetical protein